MTTASKTIQIAYGSIILSIVAASCACADIYFRKKGGKGRREKRREKGREDVRDGSREADSFIARVAQIGGHGAARCWASGVVDVGRFANNCLCGKYKSFGMD
jgi:hypothetical protein